MEFRRLGQNDERAAALDRVVAEVVPILALDMPEDDPAADDIHWFGHDGRFRDVAGVQPGNDRTRRRQLPRRSREDG